MATDGCVGPAQLLATAVDAGVHQGRVCGNPYCCGNDLSILVSAVMTDQLQCCEVDWQVQLSLRKGVGTELHTHKLKDLVRSFTGFTHPWTAQHAHTASTV